jgi:hypothetical protein
MRIGGAASTRALPRRAALNQGAVQRNHKGAGLDLRLIACGGSNHQTEFHQGNADMRYGAFVCCGLDRKNWL